MARPRTPVLREDLSPEEKLEQAYRQTFTSETGALVLDDLRKAFGRRSSFSSDPCMTAFREGERSVYLRVMQYLDPEQNDPEEVQP